MICPEIPVVSVLLVRLTVFPNRQNLGILFPITPVTASPEWMPMVTLCKILEIKRTSSMRKVQRQVTSEWSPILTVLAASCMSKASLAMFLAWSSQISGNPDTVMYLSPTVSTYRKCNMKSIVLMIQQGIKFNLCDLLFSLCDLLFSFCQKVFC